MKDFDVYVQSQQSWTYVYKVKAKNAEQAQNLGLQMHDEGLQSHDSWVDDESREYFQTIEG